MLWRSLVRRLSSDEERRFVFSLGLSVALHVWVIGFLQPSHAVRYRGAYGELSVTFIKTATLAQMPIADAGTVESLPSEDSAAKPLSARVPERPAVKPAATAKKPQVALDSRAGRASPSVAAPSPLKQDIQAAAGTRAPQRGPGEVSMLLVIDVGGRPGKIIWNSLPALTNEQLRILEARIRSRSYGQLPQGTTVNEVIDVFAVLGVKGEEKPAGGL